jgi:hypothetical protein
MTFPNEKSEIRAHEIEKTKAEIQVLTKKLSFLEEMARHKSPAEEAYKKWWGEYPGTETWTVYDETRWVGFQKGYNTSYEETVSEYQPTPLEKLQESNWYVDPKTLLKSNWEPKPQTPEETEKSLKDAMKTAQSEGVFDQPEPETLTLKNLLKKWEFDFSAKWENPKNRTSELYEEEVERFIQMFTEWMPDAIGVVGDDDWDDGWKWGQHTYRDALMEKLK